MMIFPLAGGRLKNSSLKLADAKYLATAFLGAHHPQYQRLWHHVDYIYINPVKHGWVKQVVIGHSQRSIAMWREGYIPLMGGRHNGF